MIKILPSIASADQMRLSDEMSRIGGTGYLHIDIEDGNFLPNITFGMKTIRAICENRNFEYDAHLLTLEPERYFSELYHCGVKRIAFHVEAVPYPLELLNKIKKYGMKAGLAFNFKTPLKDAAPFVEALDYIIIMTAEPDGEGNLFCPAILDKLREAKKIFPKTVELWVDGGIKEELIKEVADAGANAAVLGRALWNSENPREKIEQWNNIDKGVR